VANRNTTKSLVEKYNSSISKGEQKLKALVEEEEATELEELSVPDSSQTKLF
jgi:hypothetical protein